MKKMFLDDERLPPGNPDDWIIVRDVKEAIRIVTEQGCPDFISFDNDMGPGALEGWWFAQWLIDWDYETRGIPEGFRFVVHSMNPVRAGDITARLNWYLKDRGLRNEL